LSKICSEATQTHSLSATTTKSEDNPTSSSSTTAILIDDIDVILDPDVNFLPSLRTVVQTTKVPLFLTLTIDESPSQTQNERSLEDVKTLISSKYPFLAGFINSF